MHLSDQSSESNQISQRQRETSGSQRPLKLRRLKKTTTCCTFRSVSRVSLMTFTTAQLPFVCPRWSRRREGRGWRARRHGHSIWRRSGNRACGECLRRGRLRFKRNQTAGWVAFDCWINNPVHPWSFSVNWKWTNAKSLEDTSFRPYYVQLLIEIELFEPRCSDESEHSLAIATLMRLS